MTSIVKLAIDLPDDESIVWQAMASRSGRVAITSPQDCEALITNDSSKALSAVDQGRAVLAVSPWSLPAEARAQLANAALAAPAAVPRFRPDIVPMKQALDDGKLGEPGLLRCHQWRRTFNVDDTAVIAPWLDVTHWLFGKEPERAYALQREGYRQIHLGFDGGGMAVLDFHTFDANQPPLPVDYETLSLIGSTGAIYADDHRNMSLWLHKHGTSAVRMEQRHTGLALLIDAFAKSVAEESPFAVRWRDVEAALQVAGRVAASLQEQAAVAIAGGQNG